MNSQKKNEAMSSHLDRTSMVNKRSFYMAFGKNIYILNRFLKTKSGQRSFNYRTVSFDERISNYF